MTTTSIAKTVARYQCEGCEKSIRANDYCRCPAGRQKEVDDVHADIAQQKVDQAKAKVERDKEHAALTAELEAMFNAPDYEPEPEPAPTPVAKPRPAPQHDDSWERLRRQAAKERADAAQDAALADRKRAVEERELDRRERRLDAGHHLLRRHHCRHAGRPCSGVRGHHRHHGHASRAGPQGRRRTRRHTSREAIVDVQPCPQAVSRSSAR